MSKYLPYLMPEEAEVFSYVDDSVIEQYAERIYFAGFNAYAAPRADLYIHKLEQVVFEPEHVRLPNKNWMIDVFGSAEDYAEFAKRDTGQKFYIYQGDTGTDTRHEAFAGAHIDRLTFTGQPIGDRAGHGTFVASMYVSTDGRYSPFPEKVKRGEIAAQSNNVLKDSGAGNFAHIINSLVAAKIDAPNRQKQGYITLMNLSLGADAPTPPRLARALKEAREAGIIILAATGNSALNQISTPANDPNTVAVMALTPTLDRANFSNVGEGTILAAGGVMCYGAKLGGGSGFNNGTSFATPFELNTFIAAASLYSFDTTQDIIDYVISRGKDLGRVGYDTTYGNGISVLRNLLDNPPTKAPVKKNPAVSLGGYTVRYVEDNVRHQFRIDGLEAAVYGGGDLEQVDRALKQLFATYRFRVNTNAGFPRSVSVISLVERMLRFRGISLKFNSARVDNADGSGVKELNQRDLHYYNASRVVFRGSDRSLWSREKPMRLLARAE